jgi:hypothetical protein
MCSRGTHAEELLNADFEDLIGRLVGSPSREGYGATSSPSGEGYSERDSRAGGATSMWSFTENGQAYDATFEAVAHGHAILERNLGFIAAYHAASEIANDWLQSPAS